jgi:Sulfotransferase domain
MSRLPDFIVIGAMKCATSTLHEQLAHQPGFFLSTPKEPGFFSDPDQWAKGLEWYCSLFDGAAPGDLAGESSTHYTMLPSYPESAARMRGVLGDRVKLVYIMRDPLDRLVSHYIHDWSQGLIDTSIDEAVTAHSELVDYGRYAYQLKPYLEIFGPERILPVFFEHLTANPSDELKRVCRFLGYSREPIWRRDFERQNPSEQRMRDTPVLAFLRSLPGSRPLRRALLPERVRERIKRAWKMESRPELSAEAREGLTRVFDADLKELGAWLGLELDSTSFKDSAERTAPAWSATCLRRFGRDGR